MKCAAIWHGRAPHLTRRELHRGVCIGLPWGEGDDTPLPWTLCNRHWWQMVSAQAMTAHDDNFSLPRSPASPNCTHQCRTPASLMHMSSSPCHCRLHSARANFNKVPRPSPCHSTLPQQFASASCSLTSIPVSLYTSGWRPCLTRAHAATHTRHQTRPAWLGLQAA